MDKILNDIVNIYKDIIHEILNDEYKLNQFVNKVKNNLKKKNKKTFLRNFNTILLENKIPNLDIKIMYTNIQSLKKFLQNLEIRRSSPIYYNIVSNQIDLLLYDDWFPRVNSTIFYSSGTSIEEFEFKIQLLLSEIAKLPEPDKGKIIQIFYDTLSYELPERRYINTQNTSSVADNNITSYPSYITVTSYNSRSREDTYNHSNIISTSSYTKTKEDISQYLETYNETLNNCKEKILSVKNYSDDNSLKEECRLLENKIQEKLKNAEADLSKDIKNALDNLNDIVAETNKLYSESSNIKEKMDSIHQKCIDKLKEVRDLSQDFEYAIKNDYYKDCDDIESRLNNCVDNKDEVNKIIDEINNLYRNAYNRKYNKSSLSYVMDIEEDDIDLLEHI